MKILAIGTSGQNCTVAISEDNLLIKEININDGLTHSQKLMPSIDKILSETSTKLESIDTYAVSIGPGSFTGIRIGISTVKGLCLGVNRNVVAVPSLLGIAYSQKNFDGYIVSCMDAKNDNIYAAIYKKDSDGDLIRIGDYFADSAMTLVEEVLSLDDNCIIVGDGKKLLKSHLDNYNLPFNVDYASDEFDLEYASNIALAGLDLIRQGLVTTGLNLSPLYLKKSQAERELDKKL